MTCGDAKTQFFNLPVKNYSSTKTSQFWHHSIDNLIFNINKTRKTNIQNLGNISVGWGTLFHFTRKPLEVSSQISWYHCKTEILDYLHADSYMYFVSRWMLSHDDLDSRTIESQKSCFFYPVGCKYTLILSNNPRINR